MKYIDEFRDKKLIDALLVEIREAVKDGRRYNIMEVCGTHTMNIFRFGLKDLLPDNINLISGPGCPVCVTPNTFLDKAIALASMKDVTIATFGDMFRVPGSYSSLEKEKARGSSIKIVYSSMDALEMAGKHKNKEVVFLGIGFETTIPTVAVSILEAKKKKIKNYSVLCGHKTMPGILGALAKDRKVDIDGFLLPGHVSAVIGPNAYRFLSAKYHKRCVIAGFEPIDILQGILMLVKQKIPKVELQYTRIINSRGNELAQKSIDRVFTTASSIWRGIGMVENSGLKIKDEFYGFDAESRFKLKKAPAREHPNCMCGDILRGIKKPSDCQLYSVICSPENPIGSCMVSSEGTCAAYYKYGVRS